MDNIEMRLREINGITDDPERDDTQKRIENLEAIIEAQAEALRALGIVTGSDGK